MIGYLIFDQIKNNWISKELSFEIFDFFNF